MTETAVSSSPAAFARGPQWETSPPPPPITGRPFTWGTPATPRRPCRAGGRPGAPSQESGLRSCEGNRRGGDTTILQPRQLGRVPARSRPRAPARQAPRPGTSSWPRPPPHCLQPSSSETASEAVYASFAAVARRMSARRRCEQPGRSGGRERWEDCRPGSGLQRLGRRPRRGRRSREGADERAAPPSPAVTPPAAPRSPALSARRGGRWRAVPTRTRRKTTSRGPAA